MNDFIICGYCGADNPDTRKRCRACKEPLNAPAISTVSGGGSRQVERTSPIDENAICDLIDRMTDATVFITCLSFESGNTGTGFFMKHEGETYLITNFHVVEEAAKGGFVLVRFSETINKRQDNFRAMILNVDPINDLALLEVQCPIPSKINPLELADLDTLRNGQDVIAVGSPREFRFTSIRGCIAQSNLQNEGIQMSQILCSLNAAPGNSGGAVVRVSDSRVIGVATMIVKPEHIQSHTVCVSADAVRQLIFMHKRAGKRG